MHLRHKSAHSFFSDPSNPFAPGRWCGGLVAVKIVAHNCALSSLAEVLRESALSTSITHPNVVRAVRLVVDDHQSHVHLISGYTTHCPSLCTMLERCISDCTCRGYMNHLKDSQLQSIA